MRRRLPDRLWVLCALVWLGNTSIGTRCARADLYFEKPAVNAGVVYLNGAEIFRADLHPAIAANPFIAFSTVAVESGTLTFQWTGDNGFSVTESARITVE